jgi:hypothetical protein
MADPFPEYDTAQYETVSAATMPPSAAPSQSVRQSMGAVEIGVVAIAVAVAIMTASAILSVSRAR